MSVLEQRTDRHSLGSLSSEEASLSIGHRELKIALVPCDSLSKSLPFLGLSFLACEMNALGALVSEPL